MLSKLVLVSLIVSSQCYASKVATIKTQRNVEVNINRVVYNNSIDSTDINQVRKSTAVNRGTELNSRMAIREVDSSEKVVVIENREVDLASYKYLEVFAKSREDSRVKVGVLTKDDSIFYETVDLKFEKTFRWFQVPLEFLKQKVIQSGKSLSSIKSFLIASTEESVDSSKIDAISVKSVHLVNKGRAVESKYKILSVNDSEGSKVSEPDGTFVANIQNISDDSVSPNITNLMLNDRVVISGDYIDAQTTVSFLSNDVDSGLATWNVSFLLDSRTRWC